MKRPSAATGISLVALFFSLGGVGLAASHYLITSKSQIKPSVLDKLEGSQGPAGAPGPVGATGPAGPAGPAGAAGVFSASDLSVTNGPTTDLSPLGDAGDVGSSTATCPTGDTVVSGGYTGDVVAGAIDASEPVGNTWEVIAGNVANIEVDFQAIAVCAS